MLTTFHLTNVAEIRTLDLFDVSRLHFKLLHTSDYTLKIQCNLLFKINFRSYQLALIKLYYIGLTTCYFKRSKLSVSKVDF